MINKVWIKNIHNGNDNALVPEVRSVGQICVCVLYYIRNNNNSNKNNSKYYIMMCNLHHVMT